MDATFTLGSWLAPALVTLAAVIWIVRSTIRSSAVGAMDTVGKGMVTVLGPLALTLVSLSSWLLWHVSQLD